MNYSHLLHFQLFIIVIIVIILDNILAYIINQYYDKNITQSAKDTILSIFDKCKYFFRLFIDLYDYSI